MSTQPRVVRCPGCNVPMGVKLVTIDTGTTTVIYACVICREETERLYKVLKAPPSHSPDENRAP